MDQISLKLKSATDSQLTNFCIDPFVTSVATSSIAADGYAPSNLTSTHSQTRSKGFRVEHFMRPPIHLDFEFNIPINVACVIISPNFEEDCEMRIELSGSFQATSPNHQYKLCHGAVIKSQKSILVLKNRAYQECILGTQTLEEAVKDVHGSYIMRFSLVGGELMEQPLKYANILAKLRTLRLTVSRMSGPKPVALKSLEVWGALSKVSNSKQREVYQTALSVLPCTLQNQLSVFQDTPLTGPGPNEQLKGKHGCHLLCSNVHKEDCCSCSPGQHNSVEVHERKDSMFQSQHTYHLETNEQSIVNSCELWRSRAPSTSVSNSGLLSWKERNTQTGTSTRMNPSSIPNKMSQRNQVVTEWRDGRHFAGCSNEVIPQAVKPDVSLQGNTKILAATGFSPQPSRGSRWVVRGGHPQCTSFPFQSCKPSSCNAPSSASYDHNEAMNSCDSPQAEHQLSCICMSSTCTKGVKIPLEENETAGQSSNKKEVPNHYLDEITYEVMQLPMLLPSGHYVDRSTVDRLASNDAMYGRSPLDPFTGIVFTDSSKPEFCPKLKLQLDEFLLHSGREITGHCSKDRGKTLGSAEEIASHLRTIQGYRKGTNKRTACEDYSSRSKRSKNMSHHSCLVTHDKTMQTSLHEQGYTETPVSHEKHPALFPTISACPSTSLPLNNAQSFPTSLQGQCLDSVTTSKPPTRKRMCDQVNQNAVGGCGNLDESNGGSNSQTLRGAGHTDGDGANFETEVLCSLDRALEKVLSS